MVTERIPSTHYDTHNADYYVSNSVCLGEQKSRIATPMKTKSNSSC
jgi:hypothetical protein